MLYYQMEVSPFYDKFDKIVSRMSNIEVRLIDSPSFGSRYAPSSRWAAGHYPDPGVFIGSAQQAQLAILLNVIPTCPYAVVSEDLADRLGEKKLSAIIEAAPGPFYDVRSKDSVIGSKKGTTRFGRPYDKATFTGDGLDDTFLLSYAKSSFVSNMSETWQMSFMMDDYGRHNGLTTLRDTQALARLLTLGECEIYVPTGRGTGKKLSAASIGLLDECEIKLDASNEKVKRALESTKAVRDHAKIWQRQADAHHLSIRVSKEELLDGEAAMELFKDAAKMLELEPLLNAYKLGVDVDDIVA